MILVIGLLSIIVQHEDGIMVHKWISFSVYRDNGNVMCIWICIRSIRITIISKSISLFIDND